MTKYYCALCGENEVINARRGVIFRHIIEQHSGFGFKCAGCHRIFTREKSRHQGCQFPEGDHVKLINRLTGVTGLEAERLFSLFKATVEGKILTKLVQAPRPTTNTPTEGKRAASEAGGRVAKRPKPSSTVSMPVTSPLARVEPPPTPKFSTTATVTTSVTKTMDDVKLATRANGSVSEETSVLVLNQTANSVSESEASSLASEAEDGEIEDSGDIVSLSVGPTETLGATNVVTTPAPQPTILTRPREVVSQPERQRVQAAIASCVTEVKLASWYECQQGRVVLDIGGTRFVTSKVTLRSDPSSLLCAMTQPGSPMCYMRIDEYNSPIYFLDRDPAHFRHILNYLRLGSSWQPQSLPREIRYLHEIRTEAEFYQLRGLVEVLERRIAILNEARFDVAI